MPIGRPSEEKTSAPYSDSPTPAATYGVDWPTRGRNHKRLVFVPSAWMRPSPRRYVTSVSTLSVDVTGNVTATPMGETPADPSATYGVTSTGFASCAPAGNAARVNATNATTVDLLTRMTPPWDLSPLTDTNQDRIREHLHRGGGLAYGLGGGSGVLAQNFAVVACDLRAHLQVRVTGEHWIERGPPLLHLSVVGPEAVTGGQDEPHRAGQAIEDPHACGGDLV